MLKLKNRNEFKRVAFVTLSLMHYRIKLHELIKAKLLEHDIDYCVYYSAPVGRQAALGGTAKLDWAREVPCRLFTALGNEVFWQKIPNGVLDYDLVIIGQETKLLHNFKLLALRKFGKVKRVAFFGHGRNYQGDQNSFREKFKQYYSQLADWWFCYTEMSREHLAKIGVSDCEITVIQNTIDANELMRELDSVSASDAQAFIDANGLRDSRIGLFVGSIHERKRLDFLIKAAIEVRRQVPSFKLVIIGDGPLKSETAALLREHSWIVKMPAKHGMQKAVALKCAELILMPGLVGLVAVDSIVAGLPIITTSYKYHSPEIEYIQHGRNGIVVEDENSVDAYASAIVDVLSNEELRQKLTNAQIALRGSFSLEHTADRFVGGILRALSKAAA